MFQVMWLFDIALKTIYCDHKLSHTGRPQVSGSFTQATGVSKGYLYSFTQYFPLKSNGSHKIMSLILILIGKYDQYTRNIGTKFLFLR